MAGRNKQASKPRKRRWQGGCVPLESWQTDANTPAPTTGRDQGRTLHPLGPRPDAQDPRATATSEKQDARHAAARGLWGPAGPLLSFQGKQPTWAVRGNPSALISAGS